jgi:hypothetical protein
MPAPKDPEKYKLWRERLKARPSQVPWNKGKNLKDDPNYQDMRTKMSEAHIGREYGSPSEETRQKISDTLKGRTKGQRIGFANGGKHTEETKRKMSESHTGVPHGPMSEEQKVKVSAGVTKFYEDNPEHKLLLSELTTKRLADPAARQKLSDSIKAYFQTDAGIEFRKRMSIDLTERQLGKPLSAKHKEAISKSVTAAIVEGRYHPERWANSGDHDSPKVGLVHYRSSWELVVYQQLDANVDVLTYQVEPFSIAYVFEGSNHYYIPDLLITFKDGEQLLVEIKPSHKLNEPINIAKFSAALSQFPDRFEIWSEDLIF